MFQLLTQGSADIVLDACTDFWDGDDLCELSENDRYDVIMIFYEIQTVKQMNSFDESLYPSK